LERAVILCVLSSRHHVERPRLIVYGSYLGDVKAANCDIDIRRLVRTPWSLTVVPDKNLEMQRFERLLVFLVVPARKNIQKVVIGIVKMGEKLVIL